MRNLSKVFISCMVDIAYGSVSEPELRPMQWLYGTTVTNENRYYIEPFRRPVLHEMSDFKIGVANGVKCEPLKQLSSEPESTPIVGGLVYAVNGTDNTQRNYRATINAQDFSKKCFSSIDPPRSAVLTELNEICESWGFKILTTSDASQIEDGTYSGKQQYGKSLKTNVTGGRINDLTSGNHANVNKEIHKLSYFGVGHVISVTYHDQRDESNLKDHTLILEPESRHLFLESYEITRKNLHTWDSDGSDRYDDDDDDEEAGRLRSGRGWWKGLRESFQKKKKVLQKVLHPYKKF